MMNKIRKSGAMIKMIPDTNYGVFADQDGFLRVIGREGVSQIIKPHMCFVGDYAHESLGLSYAYLLHCLEVGEARDLKDVVRVFGWRLETNFALNYREITGEQTAHKAAE